MSTACRWDAWHKLGVAEGPGLLQCTAEECVLLDQQSLTCLPHGAIAWLKWDAGCKRITSTVKHYTNVKKYYYFYFQTNEDSAFINFQQAPHQALVQGQEHSLLKMHSPQQIMVGIRQQQQAINQAAVVSGKGKTWGSYQRESRI